MTRLTTLLHGCPTAQYSLSILLQPSFVYQYRYIPVLCTNTATAQCCVPILLQPSVLYQYCYSPVLCTNTATALCSLSILLLPCVLYKYCYCPVLCTYTATAQCCVPILLQPSVVYQYHCIPLSSTTHYPLLANQFIPISDRNRMCSVLSVATICPLLCVPSQFFHCGVSFGVLLVLCHLHCPIVIAYHFR